MDIPIVEQMIYKHAYGSECVGCSRNAFHFDMIVSIGQGGKMTWRNLYMTCEACRGKVEKNKLDKQRSDRFGINYFMDTKDLYGLGLINEDSQIKANKYFEKEEKKQNNPTEWSRFK